MRRLTLTIPADDRTLAAAVGALAEHNARLGALPPLYASGVRYQREPRGQEEWRDARDLLAIGAGDCEDLTAYRLAERWQAGDRGARAEVRGVGNMKHVYIRGGDGTVEDPSVTLGMATIPPPEFYAMPPDDNNDPHADDLAEVAKATADSLGGVDKLDPAMADHPDDGGDRDDLADEPPDEPPDVIDADSRPKSRPVSWDVARRTKGGHTATLRVPTKDGRTLRVRAHGGTRRSAMASAAAGVVKLYQSPAFRAVLPPQAAALATAIDRLARMDPKVVASKAKNAATSAARKLAAVFL